MFLSSSAQCATSSYQSRATSDSRQLVRCRTEMATGLREMSQCLEKASLLKGKCLLKLRQHAKWTSKYTVSRHEIRTLTLALRIFGWFFGNQIKPPSVMIFANKHQSFMSAHLVVKCHEVPVTALLVDAAAAASHRN